MERRNSNKSSIVSIIQLFCRLNRTSLKTQLFVTTRRVSLSNSSFLRLSSATTWCMRGRCTDFCNSWGTMKTSTGRKLRKFKLSSKLVPSKSSNFNKKEWLLKKCLTKWNNLEFRWSKRRRRWLKLNGSLKVKGLSLSTWSLSKGRCKNVVLPIWNNDL